MSMHSTGMRALASFAAVALLANVFGYSSCAAAVCASPYQPSSDDCHRQKPSPHESAPTHQSACAHPHSELAGPKAAPSSGFGIAAYSTLALATGLVALDIAEPL